MNTFLDCLNIFTMTINFIIKIIKTILFKTNMNIDLLGQ